MNPHPFTPLLSVFLTVVPALEAQVWVRPDTQVRAATRPAPGEPFLPCLERVDPTGVQRQEGPRDLQHPFLTFWEGAAWALGPERLLLPGGGRGLPAPDQRPQTLQVCRDGRTWTRVAWGLAPGLRELVPLEDGSFLGFQGGYTQDPPHLRPQGRGPMASLPALAGIPGGSRVRFLARSPRGLVLLGADGTLLVLSNRDGHLLRRLPSPFQGLVQVLVRPDGKLLLAEVRVLGGARSFAHAFPSASASSQRLQALLTWRSTHGAWGLPRHTPQARVEVRWMALDPAEGPCVPLEAPAGFPGAFRDLREAASLQIQWGPDGSLRWTLRKG